jgi:hypothetical protein
MPAHPERQLARLRARFEEHARELARIGFVLRGSVVQTYKRCSSPGCGCQSDPAKLHGPYWQWNGKINGRMTSRALSEEQRDRYREWMHKARRFDEIVEELHALSSEANEILRTIERQSPEPTERAPRRRGRARA